MKNGKLLKTLAAVTVFTVMGASLAACGGGSGGQVHNLTRHEAVDSTCTQEGNIEYWDCSHCDKLFADAEGKQEITDIVVVKKPHTIGDDDYHVAVLPECDKDGTLAYWECEICHGKFSNKDGTKELTDIVDPAAHTPVSHTKVEPTFTTPGKKQHWTCGVCGKFFLTEEADTPVTESDIVITALGEETVSVNVTVKDKTGNTAADTSAVKVKLVLQNAPFEYTYDGDGDGIGIAEGKLDLDKIGAGTYKVTGAEGYYDTTLTVTKDSASIDLLLEEIEHDRHNPHDEHPEYLAFESVNGEHRAVFNTPWCTDKDNAVFVDARNGALTGENYMAEFTVRSDYKDTGWTSRFYIAAAAGTGSAQVGYGFVFGNDADKLILTDMTGDFKFDSIVNEHKLNGKDSRYDSTDMVKALQSDQGLRLRVIRNGRAVTFYTKTATGWDAFRTLKLAGDYGARLAFAVTANETISFSNISFAEYVAAEAKESSVVLAHYVQGDKVYTSAGEETTLAALEVAQTEHFALTLKKGTEAIAKGTSVKLVNANFGTIEAEVGDDGLVDLDGKVYDSMTYTLTIDGYVMKYVFTVNGEQAVLDGIFDGYSDPSQVMLDRTFEIDGWAGGGSLAGTDESKIVLNSTWSTRTQALLDTTDALTNADVFTLNFNYKIDKLDPEWETNRFGFRVSDAKGSDICGFYLYAMPKTDVVKIDSLSGSLDFGATPSDSLASTVLTKSMLTDGADYKIEYRFGHVVLYVKVEDEWKELCKTDVAGKPQIAFAAANQTNTYTDIFITLANVEKLTTVALTLKDQSDKAIPEGTDVTLVSEKHTVTVSVGQNGVVTLDGDNAVYRYVDYTVSVDGSTTVGRTVWFDGATAALGGFVMPQSIESVTLTLKAGETPVAQGKKVTLTSAKGKIEATVGENGAVTLTQSNAVYDLITYTVKVEGYALTYDIVFDGATASITALEAVDWEFTGQEGEFEKHGIANADNITITHDNNSVTVAAEGFTGGDEWKRDGAYINLPDSVDAGTNYVVRFKLTATLTGGWTERFGIRLTSDTGNGDNVGFLIWSKGDTLSFGDLNGNVDIGDREPKTNTIITNAAVKDGIDIKIVRTGDSAQMYAKINGEWKPVYKVDLTGANKTAKLGFYAVGGTYTYSDISYTILTTPEE